MKVKVILKEDIKGVGKKDQIVEVKDGYANNFLLNTNKGVLATPENLKRLEDKKAKKDRHHKKELENAEVIKKELEKNTLELKVKVGNNGKVFGSISNKEIADLIKEKLNIDIDKKKIESVKIKEIGTHTLEVKLYENVKAKIQVKVGAING